MFYVLCEDGILYENESEEVVLEWLDNHGDEDMWLAFED